MDKPSDYFKLWGWYIEESNSMAKTEVQDGVNFVGDKVIIVKNGVVVGQMDKKTWHEMEMPDSERTPVPHSLEEWCKK